MGKVVIAVAAALLGPIACGPDAGSDADAGGPDAGGVDASTFDESDPSTGRWFGTIFVDSTFDSSGTQNPTPETVKQVVHVERAHTRIDVSDAGHRHTVTTYRLLDDEVSDVTQGCLWIHSTNVVDATASKTSDVGSYVRLVANGDTGYRSAELPGGFFIVPTTPFESHNRVAIDQCGAGSVQTSVGTESPSIAGVLPLDHIAGTLSPDRRNATGRATFDMAGIHYVVRWALQRDADIVAVVDDQTVARVAQVHLDGSKSRGTINEYDWTVEPDEGSCSGIGVPEEGKKLQAGKQATRVGETFDFPILCDVYATLHVVGPAGTSDATAWIHATPRSWQVQTNEADGKKRKSYSSSSELGGAGTAGSNRCVLENHAFSGHFIHSDSQSQFDGSAFTVEQLPSGDGPFDGNFYLDTPKIIVERVELVNVDYAFSTGSAYIETAKKNANVAIMLDEQITAHEAAHSKFVFDLLDHEAGGPNDPALRVEALVSGAGDSTDLVQIANEALFHDNEQLCLASSHSFVIPYLGGLSSSDPTTWSQAAQICYLYCDANQVCTPVCSVADPFYSAAFDDNWCVTK